MTSRENGKNLAIGSGLLALLIALAMVVGDARSAGASADPIVSVDAEADGSNTATMVGTIDTCREAASSATFDSDVVIQSVATLSGFEAHIIYDPAVLRVTGVDYGYLLSTAPGSVVDLGDTVPDSDGDFEMGAITFPLGAATGSGVLARVTFEAIGTGPSPLDLQGVKLSDALGDPVPPADGTTGEYQGPVKDASVVVDGSCASGDSDGDGYTDGHEGSMGTDPFAACPSTSDAHDEDPDAWPPDFDDSQVINIIDVLALKPVFGAVSPRHDLDNSGGTINILDVLAIKPVFLQGCV